MAARIHLLAMVRLIAVLAIGFVVSAGTSLTRGRPADPAPGPGPAPALRRGDRVPPSVAVTADEGYGRSYGIAIIDGRIILIVDRESRTVIDVVE